MDIELPVSEPSSKYLINDIRPPTLFRCISFSKYKKTDVRNQFVENIKKGKYEPACYWCAELICAGHYMDVWEIIFHYIGKYIHLGNPKIIIYLQMRYEIFRNIMSQGHFIHDIELRNNPTIRKLFAEIVCVLIASNKKPTFEPVKIDREEEFDMTQMTVRLKAPSMNYAADIMLKDDPKELFIAINEFSYNISKDKKNMLGAFYWLEWMVEFDTLCKNRKEPCVCEKRNSVPVENKYRSDIIWILWDALFHYSELLENPFINKLMEAIFYVFCIKYTTAASKKRRYLLYFAVAILTENVPTNVDTIQNKSLVKNVVDKIDEIYKQIKKNEESPNTDYWFTNLEDSMNLEKSIRKMELVNSIQFSP